MVGGTRYSTLKEMWGRVVDFLDQSLQPDGDIGFSVGLSVRESKQVEEGGMYSIPEGYVEEEHLLNLASLGSPKGMTG